MNEFYKGRERESFKKSRAFRASQLVVAFLSVFMLEHFFLPILFLSLSLPFLNIPDYFIHCFLNFDEKMPLLSLLDGVFTLTPGRITFISMVKYLISFDKFSGKRSF